MWLPVDKFWRQRFGEKRKEVFYSKAAQSRRMVGSYLRAPLLQNTLRKTQAPSARLIQGCTHRSLFHLKIPSFGNCKQLPHDRPGGLACSWLQSGFRLLPGVCMYSWSYTHLKSHFPGGFQDQNSSYRPQPTHPCSGAKRKRVCFSLPSV